MLAYILAIAIGLGSLALFLAAFFRPKLHRQDDFLWSGIGLFYALVLWLCSEQLRGGILLSHVAGVALVLTFGWQTLKLRLALANPEARAEIENFSILAWIQNRLGGSSGKKQPSPSITKTENAVAPTVTEPVEEVTRTPAIATKEVEEPIEEPVTPEPETVCQQPIEEPETVSQESIEPSEPTTPAPTSEVVEPKTVSTPIEEIVIKSKTSPKSKPETTTKSGFSLKKLFGFDKSKPPLSKPETITAALDLSETESDELEEAIPPQSESVTPVESSETTPNLVEAEIIKVEAYVEDEKTETVIEAYRVTVEKPTESEDTETPEVTPKAEPPEESVNEEITAQIEQSRAEESPTVDKEAAPEKPSSSEDQRSENPPHPPET